MLHMLPSVLALKIRGQGQISLKYKHL